MLPCFSKFWLRLKLEKFGCFFFVPKMDSVMTQFFLRLTLQQKNLFLSWLGLVLEYLSVSLLL